MKSKRWLTIQAALLLAVVAGAAAHGQLYVAFGDSITFGSFDNRLGEGAGYPARLQTALRSSGMGNAQVQNSGVSGELTTEGVSRIDAVLDGADYVLIMEGTNDIQAGISIETTEANLREMARKATNRGVEPVLATLIPRPPIATRDSSNFLTGALSVNLRDVARRRGITLADPYEVFLEQPNVFTNLYARVADDQVGHPNGRGYDVLGDVFADVLLERDTVPPVATMLFPSDGAERVNRRPTIAIDLFDFGSGVNIGATSLEVDGSVVTADIRPVGERVEIRYTPPANLSGAIDVGVVSQDLASPANSIDRIVSTFLVQGSSFRRGDVDESGRVDGIDLISLAFSFGARTGDPLYFRTFDLVADGIIDGEDLAIVANSFGRES